ncbi:MAG: two-component regulator propeller domain-containing protein [Saprospiraceae bacterium]
MPNPARFVQRLFLWAMFAFPALADGQMTFVNIGKEHGLTCTHITSLFQDSHGFIWVGTPNGLFRFDGYGCSPYFNQPNDTLSLGSNYITFQAFAEDADSNLWIATLRGGLQCFDRKTERFVRYQHDAKRPGTVSMDKLTAVEPHAKDGLWIATAGRGINFFDPKTGQFSVLDNGADPPGALMKSSVTSALELDNNGWLWIGTNNGLCRYDTRRGSFEYFPGTARGLSAAYVAAIKQDSKGNVWIGTQKGLNRWNAEKGLFEPFFFERHAAQKNAGANYIFAIKEDDGGRLWLGTNAGLIRFDPASGAFEQIQHRPDDPYSILPGPVQTILKDREGNLWLGTHNGISLLSKASRRLNTGRFLPVGQNFDTMAQSEGINAVLEIRGAVWVATQTGLYRYPPEGDVQHLPGNFTALFFDPKAGQVLAGTVSDGFFAIEANAFFVVRHFLRSKIGEANDPRTVKGGRMNAFAKDAQGCIWIAADGCLNRFEPRSGRFKKFHGKEKQLNNPSVNTNHHLLLDRSGNLWIASLGGLSRLSKTELAKPFDTPVLIFEHFRHLPGNPNAISSDVVFCLLEDTDGNIWAGTDAGLNRYEPRTGRWHWFSRAHGLPGNEVVSLVQDRAGNLWIGDSDAGLGVLHKKSGRIYRFSRHDGLPTERFRPNAAVRTETGLIAMGGRTGLAAFHPDSLLPRNRPRPPLYFTDFRISNRSVLVGDGGSCLKAPIYKTRFIELEHDQNVLTFEVAALDFATPGKQQYRFRLVPFHGEWQYNGNKRDITFTNLRQGAYALHVEASENGYDWSGTTIGLRIRPPWYRTWWAYLMYALTMGGILFGIRRFELRRKAAQNEAQRLKELDSVKTRLYTNITHEFRTPLTVILGEAAQLEKQAGTKQKDGLSAIRRQGRQLLNLVNQMLDLAKVEAGSLPLNLVQDNVVLFLKYLLESFHSLADSKGIELQFEADSGEFWMDFDPDKLQKIVTNLLSNAVKFTPPGGQVTLRARAGETLQFSVADTGPGIATEKLPLVFDRFYQAPPTQGAEPNPEAGTGIGLALTRELVHLLGGQVRAESRRGMGAIFTVTLPVTRTAEQRQVREDDFFAENPQPVPVPEGAVHAAAVLPRNSDRPHLLLIEDNPDVRRYLSSLLATDYHLHQARHGREGVESAFRLVPDLVVSDVMMPEMDGFEVCHVLKTDVRTSHIPVVLLTAKADQPSKIEGLKFGADAYLAKPFHPEELFAQLRNLIELRRRLQEKYAGQGHLLRPADTDSGSLDERFLQKVIRIVAENMADDNFGTPQLCAALHMSRSNAFRKIKALTGRSATHLIRSLRLEKARELLETTDLTVTEVCFRVGFDSPNYFSRAFHEEFGISASEVRRG